MMRYGSYWLAVAACASLLLACSAENDPLSTDTLRPIQISSSVDQFQGDPQTRVNVAGNAFLNGDRMRLKIICPYISSKEYGEDNWSAFDGLWLQKWTGSGWTPLAASDGCDINGDGRPSGASDLQSSVHAQQTPYVFTAQTWSQEVVFRDDQNKTVVQYVPVFHADQTDEQAYRESDLLWAQTIMQTATDYVHLSFKHVMAALHLTLSSPDATLLTQLKGEGTTLTLQGMPDIDGAEVIVGDQYAANAKTTSYRSNYGYARKNACNPDANGKVTGIGYNQKSDHQGYVMPMQGNSGATNALSTTVANTATYQALRLDDGSFRLIVPPCELVQNPIIWVRLGEQRWRCELKQKKFEQGRCYAITVNI